MPDNKYLETIEWLFQQFPAYHKIGAKAYKPDLTNCHRLCELFDNPHLKLRFIHIAGTNGKGSTSSMLASILQESGEKVGLFTSPHIEDFRERIRVNGEMISEAEVIDFCEEVKSFHLDFEPSFFEITWIMTLLHFLKENCSICVIETGLGGRLDATNIINPILSIITNIGLEHTNFLGETYEKIAFEKAGIIKNTIPIVIGETLPQTKTVFEKIANERKSPIYFAEKSKKQTPNNFPLLGDYQLKNYRIIDTAIPILNDLGISITELSIYSGLQNLTINTGFRGRMQIINKTPLTIMDVSHNYDGIKATLESLQKINKGNLKIVYGTSSDKDLDGIFSLFPLNAAYFFTEFNNERSADLNLLKEKAEILKLNASFFLNPKEALFSAQKTTNEKDTIIVFGSFFLISDFF